MAAKETDQFMTRPTTFIEPEGTSLMAALDVARKYGAVREHDLPFSVARLYKGDAKAFYLIASQFRIGAYFNLGLRLRDWRERLANHGPVLTGLDCDDTRMGAKATAGMLAEYHPDTAEGGHAVALVGYDEDRFIVRNSWGAPSGATRASATRRPPTRRPPSPRHTASRCSHPRGAGCPPWLRRSGHERRAAPRRYGRPLPRR